MKSVSLQQYNTLRAVDSTPENRDLQKLRAVAEQFEAVFVEELLKTSRNSALKSGLFDSSHTETYEEMLHREFSLSAAQNSTLGIAEALTEQFSSKIGVSNR